MRRVGVAVATVVILATIPGAPNAGAIDHAKGHAGFCRTADGVTVVVDFQQLGGPTIVRCNPQRNRGTGLDALEGAGFQIAGVQRWGKAFICRIENRPSATETLPVTGNPGYRENCVDTPPAAAYWSYWHAGNNCPWSYSQWGVKNRDFIPGGFEGWSFSWNATADANPVPRIAPVRPGTEGHGCGTAEEPGPSTDHPGEQLVPGRGTAAPRSNPSAGVPRDGGGGSAGSPRTDHADPATAARREPGHDDDTAAGRDDDRDGTTTTDPATLDGDDPDPGDATARGAGVDPEANVAFTGGEDAPDVRDVLRDESGASPSAPWVALGGIIVLAGIAGWVEGRRRRRRTS